MNSLSLWINTLHLKILLFALCARELETQLAMGLIVPAEGEDGEKQLRRTILYTISNASAETISSVSQSALGTQHCWFSPRGSVCACHAWTNIWLYELFRRHFISTFHSWKYTSASNTRWINTTWLSYWLLLENLKPLRSTEPQEQVKHPVLGVLVQQERHWKAQ